MTTKISFRRATSEDVPFVAWTVLTALDLPTDDMSRAEMACSQDDSLYSWRHAMLAVVGEKTVGCLISYNGGKYLSLREHTWKTIWAVDDIDLQRIEAETTNGEYYLDSMAILPEYRGMGIGKLLIQDAISKGKEHGCDSSTLIVSQQKPKLQAYYSTLGFKVCGMIDFFGHKYNKMILKNN